MNRFFVAAALFVFSHQIFSADFNMKRVVVTWDGGETEDTNLNQFNVSGTISINGQTIMRDNTICHDGSCKSIKATGTILSVGPNNSNATIRDNENGEVDNVAILTLSPNIIIVIVYDDGTVHIEEWEPVEISMAAAKKILSGDEQATGTVFGIAPILKAIKESSN